MGLISSIKKGFSKAWGGVKKVVKGVAKGVKKVAKGVVTALPGGQKLWKEGGRLGSKVMAGIGKISSKLGPVGMMALSFVLAPVMGPLIGSLWSGFGAGAATMAASANTLVSTLGSIGSGVFAAGNFVGGTLGAMGNALTEGASNVMAGNFSGAIDVFATNMSSALTGNAGMSAVHAGAAQAASTAASNVATGNSMFASEGAAGVTQTELLNKQAAASLDSLAGIDAGQAAVVARDSNQLIDSMDIDEIANSPEFDLVQRTPVQMHNNMVPNATTLQPSGVAPFDIDNALAMNAYGAEGVQALNNNPVNTTSDSNLKDTLDKASSLLGGSSDRGMSAYTPSYRAKSISAAGTGAGQGSSGFSLLGGVQGLEQSIRNSQQLMFG